MKSILCVLVVCSFLLSPAWAGEDVVHRSQATNLQSNGWHLAQSTEGEFSVLVPWPFWDTTINATTPMYTIISASRHGTTYTAILIPKGTQPGVFETFESDLANPNMEVGQYQGHTTIYGVDSTEEDGFKMKNHTKRIKTESGIYILMVVSLVQNERPPDIEKFFKSLMFPRI